jgi:hypothetical protein
MIRRKAEAGAIPRIERARASLVASFASGVVKDEAAVRAAINLPWSNGQTEGQITRLKLVRRQMYGRGKINLLQAMLAYLIERTKARSNLFRPGGTKFPGPPLDPSWPGRVTSPLGTFRTSRDVCV